MNYEELSDYDVNEAVAKKLGVVDKDFKVDNSWTWKEGNVAIYRDHHTRDLFKDYCNSPSDAWPIIVKYGISIWQACSASDNSGLWNASIGDVLSPKVEWTERPLRAAMLCFVKMKDMELNDD